MANAGMLKVYEEQRDEVAPSDAVLHFVVTGSKLFTGAAALAQASELRRLGEALEARGVSRNVLALEGVQLQVSKGILLKSSTATYRVRARVALDKVADVLDAVPDLKDTTLDTIEWRYDDAAEHKARWLAQCLSRGQRKAAEMAAALGCALDGVASVRELPGPEAAAHRYETALSEAAPGMAPRRGSVGRELAGLELGPTRTLSVSVEVEFRLREARAAG